MKFLKFITWPLEFLVFLVFFAPLLLLPPKTSVRAGEAIGNVFYRLWGSRRRIAMENVSAAIERGALPADIVPEQVVKENFRHMGRSLMEINRLLFGMASHILDNVHFEGMDNYNRAAAKGKGVIIVGGHCGNWELMFSFTTFVQGEFLGVVRKQSNPFFNMLIVRARKRYGSRVVYKHGAVRALFKALKAGNTIGVAVDQAMQSEGLRIDFLGASAWTNRMPAVLAKRTGAAVVPVFNYRTPDGGFVIYALPELVLSGDEVKDTMLISSCVEDYIKAHPEQWLWIHRRWKHDDEASVVD